MPDQNTETHAGEAPPAPIRITLTPEDLTHAYWLVQRKAILTPIGFLRLFFLALITLTATAVVLLAMEGQVVWPVAIIAGLAGPIVMVPSVYYRIRKASTRIFGQQKSLQLPYTLAWTADDLIMDSAQGRAVIAWSDLRSVTQDRRTILFHESDVLFRIVPRRALTPEQQADLLRVAAAGRARKPQAAADAAASAP